jgi:Coenzyme PQQ synthesis protein D (PqqD)
LSEGRETANPTPHPKCLLTVLEDGTGVVLNLETKFYHTLNATAVSVWRALEAGVVTQGELALKLTNDFEVAEDTALADIAVVLADFEREGLVVRQGPAR